MCSDFRLVRATVSISKGGAITMSSIEFYFEVKDTENKTRVKYEKKYSKKGIW